MNSICNPKKLLRISGLELLLVLAMYLCPNVLAQEMPPAEKPISAITITATDKVQLGKWIRIQVNTNCEGVKVRIRQHLINEDLSVEGQGDDTNLVQLSENEYAFTLPSVGKFTIHASAWDGTQILDAYTHTEIDGIQPVVIIPDDDDEVVPPPPPEPLVQGPRELYIIKESSEDTPELSSMIVQLRNLGSDEAKYLSTNKHKVIVLDPDHSQAAKWLPIIQEKSQTLPVIIVIDPKLKGTESVLYIGKTPNDSKALVELVKQFGG